MDLCNDVESFHHDIATRFEIVDLELNHGRPEVDYV